MQPIPVKEEYEVIITFIKPVKNDSENTCKTVSEKKTVDNNTNAVAHDKFWALSENLVKGKNSKRSLIFIPDARRLSVFNDGLASPFSILLMSPCAIPVFSDNCF